MIQVATSTSEQTELLATVTDICTRIDRYHGNIGFQPLVFLKQDIDFAVYMALLSMADCLMISALRDGMNLTAHGVGNLLLNPGNGSLNFADVISSTFSARMAS